MTDAEAMAALSRGDIAALDALVVRHNDRAQRLAFGVLRDSSVTHDVVADSFLAAAASARTYDPARPFQPWFDRIVVNRAIKEFSGGADTSGSLRCGGRTGPTTRRVSPNSGNSA